MPRQCSHCLSLRLDNQRVTTVTTVTLEIIVLVVDVFDVYVDGFEDADEIGAGQIRSDAPDASCLKWFFAGVPQREQQVSFYRSWIEMFYLTKDEIVSSNHDMQNKILAHDK